MEEEGLISYVDIQKNNYTRIEYLLKNKADPNTHKYGTMPPLCHALIYNQKRIASLLLEYKANVNCADASGNTALHWSVWKEPEFVPLLIANGANIESFNIYGNTPLRDAICSTSDLPVHFLLDAGAKVSNLNVFIPRWVQKILAHRSRVKHIIITLFALNKRTKRIHKDLTNVIGAMIWETRMDEVWAATPAFGGGRPTKK